MAYLNRVPDPGESDTPHALQLVEHEHADKLQEKLQQREHDHQDILQEKLQRREHDHQDILQEKLQRREHDHQDALLDRREAPEDFFPTNLALIAIIAAIALNGSAMLLELGHATPLKMAPFSVGLVAGFIPTLLAWTVVHRSRRLRAKAARYLVRLLWLASIVLFAIGSIFAAT